MSKQGKRALLRSRTKAVLFELPGFRQLWTSFRRRQLHREYAARRERYAAVANRRGLIYREADVVSEVRDRLRKRGYSPAKRTAGNIHTFTFMQVRGWNQALFADLAELGPVSEFDYAAQGYAFSSLLKSGGKQRREMNRAFMAALREAHNRRPVDWVYVYASGREVLAEIIRCVTEELGVPTANMCLDDKQSWTGPRVDGQRSGQIDIAAAFDLSWTSARVACEWYLCENARPVYMPEGFDAATHGPMAVDQDIPVSFVGGAYGFRPEVCRFLRRCGIPIRVFGKGWGRSGEWCNRPVEIFNRSRINLGMGGIGYSESLTSVKGRDFEVPATGGGLYLTSFNSDLAQHFDIGREIVCYRNRDEMLELIRYYLARPDEARQIALAGRERCLREHRWFHRFERSCRILGVLAEESALAGNARHSGVI